MYCNVYLTALCSLSVFLLFGTRVTSVMEALLRGFVALLCCSRLCSLLVMDTIFHRLEDF